MAVPVCHPQISVILCMYITYSHVQMLLLCLPVPLDIYRSIYLGSIPNPLKPFWAPLFKRLLVGSSGPEELHGMQDICFAVPYLSSDQMDLANAS